MILGLHDFWLAELVRQGYTASSHTIDVGGTQVIVDSHDGLTAICCVGSNERRDWAYNFDFRPVPTAEFPGQVYEGFYRAWIAAIEYLKDLIPEGNLVLLTGHSLGAALAMLNAYHLVMCDYAVIRVLTFGGSRLGNQFFVNRYNTLLGHVTTRHVHTGDPVVLVPPYALGYRHVGGAVFKTPQGRELPPSLGVLSQWGLSAWAWVRHRLGGNIDFASDDYHDWRRYLSNMEGGR